MKLKITLLTSISFVLMLLSFLSITAAGHVPLIAGENEDISSAMHITNPAKSWAVYGILEKGEVHYFSFDINKGERIHLSLLKSTAPEDDDFYPSLLLLGPGIGHSGNQPGNGPGGREVSVNTTLPEAIILPDRLRDLGSLAVQANKGAASTYEPFGPTSHKELAEINISAPQSGRYYAAVYEPVNASSADGNSNDKNSSEVETAEVETAEVETAEALEAKGDDGEGGHYALVLGYREEFSFTDRMIAPIQMASVYIWEGQSPAIILIPYIVAFIIGILVYWRAGRRNLFSLTGMLAGFLFLATSSLILTQMVYSLSRAPWGPEVYITIAIIVFHALLGVACIRLARGEAGILQRALLAVIGTVALLAGSGMIIGPILAIFSSFLPTGRRTSEGDRSHPREGLKEGASK